MKKRILSVILAVVLCFSVISVSAETEGETAARYLNSIIKIIERYYKYGVEKEDLYEAVIEYLMEQNPEHLEGALKAATDILDDYSVYYNDDELLNFTSNVHQTYVGIGVTVQKSENGCIVTEVNEKGGAYLAGVCVDDEIISVNNESIKGLSLDEIVAKIQGEAGTKVLIGIARKDVHISLEIERKTINFQTVYYSIKDNIGNIKIDTFATGTSDEIKEALYDIEENHRLNKIIIDLRNNPGGELASVIKILDQFVPKGKTLVNFEYKEEKNNYSIKSKASFTKAPNRKIVILVNENSASASELFSGAMQYHKLATVVGTTTFGKGSMQEMMGLYDHPNIEIGDIKLTMAEFTKPDGSKINGIGIDPDYTVKIQYKDFDEDALTPMTISNRYTVGDTHSDVLAIEERLSALGYSVGEVDGVFDIYTHQATMNFQANTELYPYGVMDYTTQSKLNDVIDDFEVPIDTQLDKAIELLK